MKRHIKILIAAILLFIGINVQALNIEGNITLSDRSSTITVNNSGINKLNINPDLIFNEVGDYITYKIVLKNTDNTDYQVLSVTDNNTNQYVKFSYSFNNELNKNDKEILLTIKYEKELKEELDLKDVKTIIKLADKEEEKEIVIDPVINPKTNDNIVIYVVLLTISLVILLTVLYGKKNKGLKVLLIAILLIPAMIYAVTEVNVTLNVSASKIKVNREFTVTFDTNGAGDINPVVVRDGETLTKPADPSKTNFEFVGWYDEDGKAYDFSKEVTRDIKLEAKWIELFTVTFDTNGAGDINPVVVRDGEALTKPADPSKTNFEFVGWYDEDGKAYDFSKEVTRDIKLEAKWIELFTVTFESNGGSPVSSKIVKDGETVTKPSDPTKDYYDFVKWLNGTSEYDFSSPVTSNITLTAEWTPTEYTITYNLDNGINNSSNPATYTIETENITLQSPTKAGYAFKGWTGSNGDTPELSVTIAKGSIGDKEYTANWNGVYTVTFNVGIGSTDETNRTKEKGEEIGALPTVTEPTGYDFIGWYVEDTKIDETYVINANTIVEAKYEKEEYTVTFDSNGGSPVENANVTVKYEETVAEPTKPTREDYVFKGWKDSTNNYYNFSTPVTGNMTLTADWEEEGLCPANMICYYANGDNVEGTMGQQTITDTQTSKILLPSNYSREGYGFAGWSTDPDYTGELYGASETITFVAGQYSASGLQLWAIWVESEGNLQDAAKVASICNRLTQAGPDVTHTLDSVSALTDQRDGDTYAIAKLADGNCWMIENLRLDYDAEHNSDGSLAQGYKQSSTYGNFSGLAEPEYSNFTSNADGAYLIPTANSLYYSGSQAGAATIDIGTSDLPSSRIPRYNNTNTSNRASYPTKLSDAFYSYGNYYNWSAAIANTSYYASNTFTDADGKTSRTANTSICPRGWRLPHSGEYDNEPIEGSYYNLALAINGGFSTFDSSTELKARSFPNNFVKSGYFSSSEVKLSGNRGSYLTSTARALSGDISKTNAVILSVSTNFKMDSKLKTSGDSVRCVADLNGGA